MSLASEWHLLRQRVAQLDYSIAGFDNQFFRQLLICLEDKDSSIADRLMAYRDCLLAAKDPTHLTLSSALARDDRLEDLFGVQIARNGDIQLKKSDVISKPDLSPIYGLEKRRFVKISAINGRSIF